MLICNIRFSELYQILVLNEKNQKKPLRFISADSFLFQIYET